MRVTLTVNGSEQSADDVWPGESLLYVLRERLGLPGAKNACEQGECGSCSGVLDGGVVGGRPRPGAPAAGPGGGPCLVRAATAAGRDVVSPEAVAPDGGLSDVQQAFVDEGAVQCGF